MILCAMYIEVRKKRKKRGRMTTSGLKFYIKAEMPNSHHLTVGIKVESPFTSSNLLLSFPRWVPGSYFLREPIQHVFDIIVRDEQGASLKHERKGVDSLKIFNVKNKKTVHIEYKLFCLELSVRSNHLDATHLHLMPPYTWFLPVKGIALERLDLEQGVEYILPEAWEPATQLTFLDAKVKNGMKHWNYSAKNRDIFLDSIMEANSNPTISRTIDGRTHLFKFWDSGDYKLNDEMIAKFLDDCERIVKEYHALFGIQNWGDYLTVLHLTQTNRGGLEHLNSQTSMMPRQCLLPGNDDIYRDLLSLFSHEYVHQWNVKRLRPKSFHDYNLQTEGHSNLLWWFEGCTSWIGDMQCVRSGAWNEADWIAEFEKKLKRHYSLNGLDYESLEESSHDAWIHLYRSGPYSRERQISYYLEGELAILCIDAELQRRSKGKSTVGLLLKKLCEQHALDYPNSDGQGIDLNDIVKTIQSMEGGQNMGRFVRQIVKNKGPLPLKKALRYFGRNIVHKEEAKVENAWLGTALTQKCHSIEILRFLKDSPLRLHLKVGDEILAIDSLRTSSMKAIDAALHGKANSEVNLLFASEGVTKEIQLHLPPQPPSTWTIEGKKNEHWSRYLSSRQS